MGADRRPIATALLACVGIAAALLLLEAGLRSFTPFPIRGNQRPHAALGRVLDPRFADSDAAGFRNPAIPSRVDVVALGDSQTYGENAVREDAWPYQLARATGLAVYSFGMPGYGVLEHFWLMDAALAMHPRFVIVAIFPYNDLADYCPRARTPYWAEHLGALGLRADACPVEATPRPAGWGRPRRAQLARSTGIGALLNDLDRRYCTSRWFGASDAVRHLRVGGDLLRFHAARLREADRLMNVERPAIAAARSALPVLFAAMHARARAAGASLGVVFIPTRERVVFERVRRQLDPGWSHFVELEERLDRELREELDASGIPSTDALAPMREALERAEAGAGRLYYCADGHPTALGQEAYARAAAELLGRLGGPSRATAEASRADP